MRTEEEQRRVLFVDDEPSIRLTLQSILQDGGFEVRTASSVPEALVEINCGRFDVLISDLNIGEEGDGFLVVSAMRHLQPECVNFILTGYPAFETALQAIHNQVDDYLVKPIDVDALMGAIQRHLVKGHLGTEGKTLATLLRENHEELTRRIEQRSAAYSPRRQGGNVDAGARVDASRLLTAVIEYLDGDHPELPPGAARIAVEYGRQRGSQGYTVPLLTRDFQVLRSLSYDLVQQHLAGNDIQSLLRDLGRADDCCQKLTEKALEGLMASTGTRA